MTKNILYFPEDSRQELIRIIREGIKSIREKNQPLTKNTEDGLLIWCMETE